MKATHTEFPPRKRMLCVSLLLAVCSTSLGLGESFPGEHMDGVSWVHREGCPKQHLPCLSVDVIPLLLLLLVFFSFLFFFFSRFPDSGLKMKRKSYCLITTAVTSIKCYLKVNGLHMLKTLELLTDHCKVSRIFNNLHVTCSPMIFGAG